MSFLSHTKKNILNFWQQLRLRLFSRSTIPVKSSLNDMLERDKSNLSLVELDDELSKSPPQTRVEESFVNPLTTEEKGQYGE